MEVESTEHDGHDHDGHDHGHDHDGHDHDGHGHGHGDTAADWDETYLEQEQRWSGHPNGTLPVETAHLEPGTALDVGCGEGADAIWLALRGWTVTALDISDVAVGRARRAAEAAGVEIAFTTGDVGTGIDGRFDLVSVHYPAFKKAPGDPVQRALLGAVAPGGTLLAVGHDVSAHEAAHAARERGFDPADYVLPPDLLEHLGDGWAIETNETRSRITPPGYEGPDVPDIVLRARRTG